MDVSLVLGGSQNRLCEGMDREEYDAVVGLNPSRLTEAIQETKPLLLSARHFRQAWDCGRADSDAMRWGRAMHTLLFERGLFEETYTYWSSRRQGKDWEKFKADAEAEGQEILTADQYFSALEAANRFVEDETVQGYIAAGKPEVGLLVVEDGCQCKGRVDWLSSKGVMPDLKTAARVTPRAFGKDFFKYKYDVKLGLYQRWARKLTDRDWRVSCITIENHPPFDLVPYSIPQAVLDEGVEKGLRIIRLVKSCILSGKWLGISGGEENPLEVPNFIMEETVEWEDE